MLFAIIGLCVVVAAAVTGGIYLALAMFERLRDLEDYSDAADMAHGFLRDRVDTLETKRRPGRPRKIQQEAA